jgi:threonine aldolase
VSSQQTIPGAIKPRDHAIYPPTTLVEVENTHNRAGGVVFPQDEAVRICAECAQAAYRQLSRWSAPVECRRGDRCSLSELAAPFDLVGVSLSKGLGAPGGSLLAGSRDIVARALRHRRMMGGAMRQVGIFAAAGIFALDNNMTRLVEDHANARLIAERLASARVLPSILQRCRRTSSSSASPPDAPDATTLVANARARGVSDQCLWTAYGPRSHPPRCIARSVCEGCQRPGRDCQRLDSLGHLSQRAAQPQAITSPAAWRLGSARGRDFCITDQAAGD